MAQDGPKMPQDGPKMAQRDTEIAPLAKEKNELELCLAARCWAVLGGSGRRSDSSGRLLSGSGWLLGGGCLALKALGRLWAVLEQLFGQLVLFEGKWITQIQKTLQTARSK